MADNTTPDTPEAAAARIAPIARGLLAEPTGCHDVRYHRVILSAATTREAGDYAASGDRGNLKACPIPVDDADPPPLFMDGLDRGSPTEEIRETVAAALDGHRQAHGVNPRMLLVPDVGIFRVTQEAGDPAHPLANEVALVTGAAGAIGSGICRSLMANGCRVAATDLAGEHLDGFIAECEETATGSVIGVPLDVTDPVSVHDAFSSVAREWGGVDIVIANAGIPLIASLTEMKIDDFRRLERVNIEGALLTLAEAGRHMRTQGTGGDIVVMSTKNVFSPGARFGAYSATKAAAHQLGRIASLEFAEFDVRVNMVSPDAVFADRERKSGLWEAIGPDRMRHKGIDEAELQEHYRTRNLLKARVTADHVANGVMFFVTRQTPTTGGTIPIDGGLPDATPR